MAATSDDPSAAYVPAGGPQSYTTFRLSDSLFGTRTDVVKEITALPPLTPIPHAPPAVRGYVNLRGHIVLVVDLKRLLRHELTMLGPDTRLIVFKPELGDAFGVLVERIGDIIQVSSAQIERYYAGQEASGPELRGGRPEENLIRGVGKLRGELLSILEARALLPCLESAVAAGGTAAATRSLASVKEISL